MGDPLSANSDHHHQHLTHQPLQLLASTFWRSLTIALNYCSYRGFAHSGHSCTATNPGSRFARTPPSNPTMASPENPFVPPRQPCRRWRYPGQNFAMIQQNGAELSWSERTRSWVDNLPRQGPEGGVLDTQRGKRKVLEELHNTNNPSTQHCEFSNLKRPCLPRSCKKMMGGPTQKNGGDERRGELSSSTRRGRRAGAGRGRGRGIVQPKVDHDVNNEDDPLATGRSTPKNPSIVQI